MQIRTLEGIVEGKLVNLPSISFITQIHTQVNKVNEGDLFISNNFNDIKSAIINGAFAIMYDCNTIDIDIDREIAWIKVDDIKHATIKLTRFLLSTKNINSLYCDDITLEFINTIITNKKYIKALSGDILMDFNILKSITKNEIVVSSNEQYLFSIDPLATKISSESKNSNIANLTIHSLFVTSFSYHNYFFDYIRLPYLYIDQFISLIEFIGENKYLETNIDITQLKNIEYLSPIFIDNHYKILDFGKSNRFIIANKNINLIDSQISFLKTQYEFAKIDIIKDYTSEEELIKIIKNSNFNALYIVGKSKKEIEKLLISSEQEQLALFS